MTLVTDGRALVFEDDALRRIAEESWRWQGRHFVDVLVDDFVVMPNHLRGILILNGTEVSDPPSGVAASREKQQSSRARKPLGQLVGAFKTRSSNEINLIRGMPGARLWQSNFHDRVVRSEYELRRIHKYIGDNPVMWEQDAENPVAAQRIQPDEGILFGASPEKHLHTDLGSQGFVLRPKAFGAPETKPRRRCFWGRRPGVLST